MAGPCCCSSNIQAAKVLGIIFVVLCLISCFSKDENGGYMTSVIRGIIGALINSLLFYGASKRSSTAVLIWMILAIIECIVFVVFGVLAVVAIAGVPEGGLAGALFGKVIPSKSLLIVLRCPKR